MKLSKFKLDGDDQFFGFFGLCLFAGLIAWAVTGNEQIGLAVGCGMILGFFLLAAALVCAFFAIIFAAGVVVCGAMLAWNMVYWAAETAYHASHWVYRRLNRQTA